MSRAGAPIELGTFVSLREPALAEAVAGSFDFAWLDLEHGALDVRDVEALTIVCHGRDCASLVRIPRFDSERLPAVIDAGVDGVVAPMIETAEQASDFASRLTYPPSGVRGFGPRRANAHGLVDRFWERSDARPKCVVQIESLAAVGHATEIAAADGVDAIVVGTADLAFSLGVPGAVGSEPVREAIAATAEAASAAGTSFGLAGGGDFSAIAALAPAATDFLVYSLDARIYAAALAASAAGLAEAASAAGFSIGARARSANA